ncbi:MAG: acylphosphatase [Lachnospiraceae bacterium]|jgi:acylphosphatase|nr:acylphosphatase [Lachnospiraceae bacterium]
MVRRHIYFSGRVQGVGFRFQAGWAAKRFRLTGWVKNLSDGRVEMEVQGEPEAIEGLLESLKNDTYIRISHIDSTELPLEEGERRFRTQY